MKNVFLIVMDSVGIGEMPDSAEYGDVGSNTLKSCFNTGLLDLSVLKSLGLFNINGVDYTDGATEPKATYGRLAEASKGKDTTIGHWEIAGIISEKPLPTYPNGFPDEVIKEFSEKCGREVICNKPYSGTAVLDDYGEEHLETGALIVYTSADSVFQIAAHEEKVPVSELYRYCEIARSMLVGEHGVGRVIARPFVGIKGNFKRTANRHDYSLEPPAQTMLDVISAAGKKVIGVGKIYDIFAGKGVTEYVRTENNEDGMDKTIEYAGKDFDGLCFVNLVDFDMVYGHRNDAVGYAKALNGFDKKLGELLEVLDDDSLLIITADHGCDPGTPSTDHSREYVPLLVFDKKIKCGKNLGTLNSFSTISEMVLKYLL